jgi:GT2 family glycosyltransferase
MTAPSRAGAVGFAGPGELADCTAVIVTYNSAADLGGLLDSLPAAAAGLRMRVVVVDNDSTDDVEAMVVAWPGVVFVPAGTNLGYSGGINLARHHVGRTRSILVLNPDLRLEPGAIERLVGAVRSDADNGSGSRVDGTARGHAGRAVRRGVGAAVPRIRDERGDTQRSLRREPSILGALGDAVLGGRWPGRPGWLSEMVWAAEPYERGGVADWATGAAILVTAEADAAVGAWDDERFFLYSEETDYCRRLREAGFTVRYVPQAVAVHRGGGSGVGPDLAALTQVNRLRYFRKYHGRLSSVVFRGVVVLSEVMRAGRAENRRALRAIVSPRSRAKLPGERRRAWKGDRLSAAGGRR